MSHHHGPKGALITKGFGMGRGRGVMSVGRGGSKAGSRAKTPAPVGGLGPPTSTNIYNMGANIPSAQLKEIVDDEDGQVEESDQSQDNDSHTAKAPHGAFDDHDGPLPAPQPIRAPLNRNPPRVDDKAMNEEGMEDSQYDDPAWDVYAPQHHEQHGMAYERPMMPHPQHALGSYRHDEDQYAHMPHPSHANQHGWSAHGSRAQYGSEEGEGFTSPPAQVPREVKPNKRRAAGQIPMPMPTMRPTPHAPLRQAAPAIFSGDIFATPTAPFQGINLDALWAEAHKKIQNQRMGGENADDAMTRISQFQRKASDNLATLERFIDDTFHQYEVLKTTVDASVTKMQRKTARYEEIRVEANVASDEAKNWGGKRYKM